MRSPPARAFLGLWLLTACAEGAAANKRDAGRAEVDAGVAASDGATSLPPCPAPGFTGVQRLTRVEYDRTVRDLLGTSLEEARRLPADNRANVFDNNAQLNSVSSLGLSAYLEAAEELAADVIARRPPSVISCVPGGSLSEEDCARQILARLGPRAYRRPLADGELEAVMAVYLGRREQGHDAALQDAIAAVLVAPQFLFKDFSGASGAAHALDPHAVATRLSYLLWGSMPDEALSEAATRGDLDEPAGLRAQIVRLLGDPRAEALLTSFSGQWLGLRLLDTAQPDPSLFPQFTPALKQDMLTESQTFLRNVFAGEAPLRDLVSAPYTFVNARLAAHYGLNAPSASPTDFVRADLAASDRRGLLGQASLLTLTSHPDRTSVVKRGKWVMDTLLCSPLPPPPSGVDVELPAAGAAANKFEELALHRTSSTCNGCHSLMDPIGFSLEAYDPIGRVRAVDEAGRPLYTTGKLTDGTEVHGLRELTEALAERGMFEPCLAANLLSYALGRELGGGEVCDLGNVGARQDLAVASFADLVLALARTPSFRNEGAAP